MISYEDACKIARETREKECPSCKYAYVKDISDRWAFTFSIYAPDDIRCMTPAPQLFVYKDDGRVEWYTIPPLENRDLLESGKEIAFIE